MLPILSVPDLGTRIRSQIDRAVFSEAKNNGAPSVFKRPERRRKIFQNFSGAFPPIQKFFLKIDF
jgi:hypothetical protein